MFFKEFSIKNKTTLIKRLFCEKINEKNYEFIKIEKKIYFNPKS